MYVLWDIVSPAGTPAISDAVEQLVALWREQPPEPSTKAELRENPHLWQSHNRILPRRISSSMVGAIPGYTNR